MVAQPSERPAHHQRPIRTAAVLGAGVMGSQIAAHLANAGLSVHLLDLPGDDDNKNAIAERALEKVQHLSPTPFFTKRTARRITVGNLDQHFDRIAEADWIVEAIVERLEVKQELIARVEGAARGDAVVSTNTSAIPIHRIAEGRSASFKRRFLGIHFSNPPRYLKLLELIPGCETDPDLVDRMAWFGRMVLGKGIVIARDTPGFIGNRIGLYEMLQSIRTATGGDHTIEEIDALTGPLMGRPNSATFRTADVVGLDTLARIADDLYRTLENDENREGFRVPDLVRRLVEKGATGAKAGRGFYRKQGQTILSVNPDTMAYEPPKQQNPGGLDRIARLRNLSERLRALYTDEGRAGAFFRRHLLDVLAYSARRIPEITANPADIDRTMRWGFGWEMGLFEMWDTIGFERVVADMRAEGVALPDCTREMLQAGAASFYRGTDTHAEVYVPGRGYTGDTQPSHGVRPFAIRSNKQHILWRNEEAVLLDLGDEVPLYQFRSRANTMGKHVVEGLLEVIDIVEQGDYRGLVIGNEGKHFSVGANLNEFLDRQRRFGHTDRMLTTFQKMIQRVHYAARPVVVATHGRVLGGGCELAMACPHPVAAAESYAGLVELAVGLIPAGGGTMRMAALAHERAPTEQESDIQPYLRRGLETVASAKVSTSAHHAQEYGFLPPHARIVPNADRRLYVAREEVLRLSNQGYIPPPVRNAIKVLGRPGRAPFEVANHNRLRAGTITEYDRHLADRLAYVMTGGDLSAPALVHEDDLLELEREVFLSLLGEKKTQERMASILQRNKPLRN